MEVVVSQCCLNISENSHASLLSHFSECVESFLNFSLLENVSSLQLDLQLHDDSLEELHDAQLMVLEQLCHGVHLWLDDVFLLVNTVLGIVSIVFLLLTLLVYILLPELHNLHGYLVTSNVLVNILQTGFLLTVFNFSHLLDSVSCRTVGYLGYFLTMAMFSWMTVLSTDLAWTINRARWDIISVGPLGSHQSRKDKK